MTPKEQAKELVEKFNEYTIQATITYPKGKVVECLEDAKECALFLVNKMIEEHTFKNPISWNIKRQNYWQEVKKEIINL